MSHSQAMDDRPLDVVGLVWLRTSSNQSLIDELTLSKIRRTSVFLFNVLSLYHVLLFILLGSLLSLKGWWVIASGARP